MRKENRVINSLRNISWGIIFKFILLILGFFNKTIIIQIIGIEYAGIASLFTSIMSVLNMAELGLNSAILFSMYNSVATKNIKRANVLLNFYKKAYLTIGSTIFFIGIFLCIKIKWFITKGYPVQLNIYIVFLIFLMNTVISYILYAHYSIILSANQREDIIYRNNIIVYVCAQLVQFITLIFWKNYYIYILISLIATMIYNYLNYRSAKNRYPEYRCEGSISTEEKKLLKKQISGLMLGKLSVISRNSFDSIVISSFLGLAATGVYGNYYYIMYSVFCLIFYFCSGMKASIGNKITTCSIKENYINLLEFSYIFYMIYGTCTIILLCLYQPFMELWVGKEYTSTFMLALLMCIYFFFFCSTGIISQYWEVAGLFWENRYRYVIEAILNLILNVILVRVIGLYGVISATIITMLFSTNILGPYILFKYYFKECSLRRYFLQQIKYFIYTAISGSIAYNFCSFIKENGVVELFIRLFISGFIAIILILYFSFNSAENQNIWEHYGYLIGIKNNKIRIKYRKLLYNILCMLVIIIIIICVILNFKNMMT